MEMNTQGEYTKEFFCEFAQNPACVLLFTAMIQGTPIVGLPAGTDGEHVPRRATKFECFELMSLMSFNSMAIREQRYLSKSIN